MYTCYIRQEYTCPVGNKLVFCVWDLLLVNSGHIRMNKNIHLSGISIVENGSFHPLIYYQYVSQLLLSIIIIIITIYYYYHLLLLWLLLLYLSLLILLSQLSSVHYFFYLSLVDYLTCSHPFYQFNIFHYIMFFLVDVN